MWRSGSSLLYALLNKHPKVGLMYEADLLLLRPVFLKPARWNDWAKRWQFWNEAFTRHGMEVSDAGEAAQDFPGAFETAHKEFARRKGAAIWGDKSPNYYDRLREMAEAFPNAKFIIVWRDPAGTANSILRAAASGNSYFSRKGSTLRGLIGYEVFKKEVDWLKSHGKQVLEVSYEDLTSQPAVAMKQVCRFLNLDYTDDVANLEGADRSAIYDGKHHSLVKGNAIVAGARPSIVEPQLSAKIHRYVRFWQRESGGTWPPFPKLDQNQSDLPSIWERLKDRTLYRLLRTYDAFTALCFCMAPLSLLQTYRTRKYRHKKTSSGLAPAGESKIDQAREALKAKGA